MKAEPRLLGPVRSVSPDAVGWQYCGLEVVDLQPGLPYELVTGGAEMAVLPLSGGPLVVDVDGRRFELSGRTTVFSAVTDWAYLPMDTEVRLLSDVGAEVALPSARATRRFDPAMVPPPTSPSRPAAPVRRRGRWRTSCLRRRSTGPTS